MLKIAQNGTEKILAAIEPSLHDLGYEVVRLNFSGKNRPTLQVMIDRQDGYLLRLEDCELASKTISALLDVQDLIASAYHLEVSSPGIDRPLTRIKDFATYAGSLAQIELQDMLNGRKRFRGIIRHANHDFVTINLEDAETTELPTSMIEKAKLILTDALIILSEKLHPKLPITQTQQEEEI